MNLYQQLRTAQYVGEISYTLRCIIVKATAEPVRLTATRGLSSLAALEAKHRTSDKIHNIVKNMNNEYCIGYLTLRSLIDELECILVKNTQEPVRFTAHNGLSPIRRTVDNVHNHLTTEI